MSDDALLELMQEIDALKAEVRQLCAERDLLANVREIDWQYSSLDWEGIDGDQPRLIREYPLNLSTQTAFRGLPVVGDVIWFRTSGTLLYVLQSFSGFKTSDWRRGTVIRVELDDHRVAHVEIEANLAE